jgi:hypothetical protein
LDFSLVNELLLAFLNKKNPEKQVLQSQEKALFVLSSEYLLYNCINLFIKKLLTIFIAAAFCPICYIIDSLSVCRNNNGFIK